MSLASLREIHLPSKLFITYSLFVTFFFIIFISFIISFKEKKPHSNTTENDYNINNWPVPLSNELHLDALKDNYDVQEIPAYDVRGNPIHPSDYEEKLAGSIARVCFSITHYLIKQHHVFNALPKDINVLRPPTSIAPTTLKRILHPSTK